MAACQISAQAEGMKLSEAHLVGRLSSQGLQPPGFLPSAGGSL